MKTTRTLRTLFVFLFLYAAVPTVSAQSERAVSHRGAVKLHKDGNYAEAFDAFERLILSGGRIGAGFAYRFRQGGAVLAEAWPAL